MKLPPQAKKVFTGVIFDVYQWEQKLFDGSTATFEMPKRADTADVIATTGDKILIISDEQPGRPAYWGLPGGRINPGEDPIASAKREFLEETGYTSSDWTPYSTEQPVGRIDWTIHTFIAKNITYKQDPHLDAGEKIKVFFISFDEFLAKAYDLDFPLPKLLRQEMWAALKDKNKKTELKTKLGL